MQKDVHGNQDVFDWDEIPVEMEDRKRTDICCIIANTAFVVILFIVCVCMLNLQNLRKMTYPADGEGSLCGYDAPDHPYLYYASTTDPAKRLCVSKCPKEGDTTLQCNPTPNLGCGANDNPKYEVTIVDTELTHNRIGLFCMPTDPEQRQNIENISHVNKKNRFMGFYDAFYTVFWLSVVAGLLYILAIYFAPITSTKYFFIAGAVFQFVGGILLLFVPTGWVPARLICFFILMALCFMSVMTLYKNEYRSKLSVCAELMKCGVTSVKKTSFFVLCYILLFIVFFMGLVVLCGFEILCVWSDAQLKFDPQQPFYSVANAGGAILTAIIFFQFYWGMSFLKQAFNFCVSGYATSWYYYKDKSKVEIFHSFKLLIMRHWGSVQGGSIVLAFLYFIDLFIDFFSVFTFAQTEQIKKRQVNNQDNEFDREQVPYSGVKQCTQSLTNLARSESMAYINLIPIPYCNASRYCEYLEEKSCFYDRSQITNRLFRLGSHVFLIGVCSLIAITSSKASSEKMDIAGVVVILIISMFTVTYFVCFFADIAEGLLLSVFLEEHLKKQREDLSEAPEDIEKLYQKEKNGEFDKNQAFTEFIKPKCE